ncbi:MAG: hypothetical protein HQK86_10135 [Nitrospinae bacterium]|nr:hypothetical protein [Nitrospinota bacterium]MBF0633710.1 hypothetical protein [Nitrospinota bacterium]
MAALFLAAMGAGCVQEPPHAKPLRIGISIPSDLEKPLPDEYPLAFAFLTDLVLAVYSEDAGVGLWTKTEPLYPDHLRLFPAFSFTQERDDGKTFYAELKPNIFFHDGSIATADDVEFSLNRLRDRNFAGKRVKFAKLSSRSFTLSSDRPEYWENIIEVPLKKRARVEGGKSISAGPYIITAVDRERRKVSLKAFEKYVNGHPLAHEVEYRLYNNSQLAMFGFMSDEADFICGLNRGQGKLIGKNHGIRVVGYIAPQIYMLAFNTSSPLMNDILLRKAVSLLMNRHDLVANSDSLEGGAIPSQYQFAMSNPVTNPQADPPSLVKAFKLLQQAGYIRTAKGWEKNGKPIRISVGLFSSLSAYIPEARVIVRWLNDAGLATSFELAKDGDPEVHKSFDILFGWTLDQMEFSQNHIIFTPGENMFNSTDPYPESLLAGVKSAALTAGSKDSIVRKIADLSYSAPLFYPVEYCAGRGNTGYEEMFFRSPIVYSVITRNTPPASLRDTKEPS